MSDSPSNDSHQDRLTQIVKAVDKLFLAHEAVWQEQVSEFLLEVVANRKVEEDAKELYQRAARALAEERVAIKAGTAAPQLTDLKRHRPEGYERMTVQTDTGDHARTMIEGWVPFEAFNAAQFLKEAPICRLYGLKLNPSLPTMFAFLAGAHDEHPSCARTILNPLTGNYSLAIHSQDPDVREIWAFRFALLPLLDRPRTAPDFLTTLELYLNHVEHYLGRLAPDANQATTRTFGPGQRFQAWEELRSIILSAQECVRIEDAWLGSDVVEFLGGNLPEGVRLLVLGSEKDDRNWRAALASLKVLGGDMPGLIEVRCTTDVHDRYVYVDGQAWRSSESFKDMAKTRTTKVVLEARPSETLADFEMKWSKARRVYPL
jgi:hypothetical protein